jgi:hypothetical protein
MNTKISLTWDYLGWKESWPTLDSYTAQFDWNSTLLTMVNMLRNKIATAFHETVIEFDTITAHPLVHDSMFQHMLFYRTKGKNKYLAHYKIVFDENLNNNEIVLSSKNQTGFDGLITIQNFLNDGQ